jgi:hypothetical protein
MEEKAVNFQENISSKVTANLQQETRAGLGSLQSEIAQSRHDIMGINHRIQDHAAKIGDINSKCTINSGTLSRIQSILDDRRVYVTPEEMQLELRNARNYIDRMNEEIQQRMNVFTEDADERIETCIDNIRQLSARSGGVKVEGGGAVGYSRETEKHLLEELGRKVDEKIANIQHAHSVASAQGSAELQSIVNAIVKNDEFDLKVKTYAGIIVDRQFRDLTHRVNHLEQYVQTNSAATAPSFHVLRDDSTAPAAGAMYSVGRGGQ